MQVLLIIILIASVAGAAPATNKVVVTKGAATATNKVVVTKGAATATNKVVVTKGAATAKSLLKTQPANSVRVKDAKNKTVDLPLMFNNNRLNKLKKETKK